MADETAVVRYDSSVAGLVLLEPLTSFALENIRTQQCAADFCDA